MRALFEEIERKIDQPLVECLRNGTIKLLSCAWLLSEDADAALDKCPITHRAVMRRRQDLPDAAFVSPEDAALMLERGNRAH